MYETYYQITLPVRRPISYSSICILSQISHVIFHTGNHPTFHFIQLEIAENMSEKHVSTILRASPGFFI